MEQGKSEADESIVLTFDDQQRVAALQRDAAVLSSLLLVGGVHCQCAQNAVVAGKRAVLDIFVNSGVIDFSSFERNYEFVRVDSGFAFVMGLETLRPNRDAPTEGRSERAATLHKRLEEVSERLATLCASRQRY